MFPLQRRVWISLSLKKTNIDIHVFNLFRRLPRSDLAFQHVRALAERYPRTKFVSIVGNKCIPDLPDARVPMILAYRKGDIKQQLVAWGADRERRIEGKVFLFALPFRSSEFLFFLRS